MAKQKAPEYNSGNSSSFSYKVQSFWNGFSPDKVPSNNYFGEINITTLKYQYSNNLESILSANRRLQLYYRIAKINEDSKMGKIFEKKYNNFYPYYLSLVENKVKIET